MIKTDEAKILLKIAAVSVIVAMAVCGTVFSSGADDSSTNNTVNPLSSDLIYVPDDYERIQWAVDNASSGDMIIVRDGAYTENVKVNTSLTIQSENGSASCIVNALDPQDYIFNVTADYVNITGFTVKNVRRIDKAGIHLNGADNCIISNNRVLNNSGRGIDLVRYSSNNLLINNSVLNNGIGIFLYFQINNTIISNNIVKNNGRGIHLSWGSDHNILINNYVLNNGYGIYLYYCSDNNTIVNNTASSNSDSGIYISLYSNDNYLNNNTIGDNKYGVYVYDHSNNNSLSNNIMASNEYGIYLHYGSNSNTLYNNYLSNTHNAWDSGKNSWNITQTAGTNIIGGSWLGGNYWSDYAGADEDGDGLGDTPYDIRAGTNKDYLPLVKPSIFDTGNGTYPSIMGTHNGTITPSYTINVSKMYTYSRQGTGGHAEYVKLWNGTGWNVTATWNGYQGDWHNLSFNTTFTLYANDTYSYTIKTGSYPQIHHNRTLSTANGWINCTEFTDVNVRTYSDWIPAIRLE
jgi:nitrous oxidase accessory protein